MKDKHFGTINEINHLCSSEHPITFGSTILQNIIYEPGKEYVWDIFPDVYLLDIQSTVYLDDHLTTKDKQEQIKYYPFKNISAINYVGCKDVKYLD